MAGECSVAAVAQRLCYAPGTFDEPGLALAALLLPGGTLLSVERWLRPPIRAACVHACLSRYWRCYYPNTDAIIYVVDSTDKERLEVAKQELWAMLEESDLANAILLIFANKQDMKGAADAGDITRALGLSNIKSRQWTIQETSALKGTGLFEGFDWLSACVNAKSS